MIKKEFYSVYCRQKRKKEMRCASIWVHFVPNAYVITKQKSAQIVIQKCMKFTCKFLIKRKPYTR